MKRAGPPFLAVAAAAALVALLVYGVAAKNDDNRTLDDAVAHSQRPAAPDRRLPVLGGTGARSLADFRGRVVVLNFWASWCTPCIREAPHLERAQQRLAGKGTVLGVTFRDASPDSQAFLKRHHLTYPNVRDVDGKLGKAYGTKALPETFVVDKAGRLVAISRGEVSDRFLDAAIAKASRS